MGEQVKRKPTRLAGHDYSRSGVYFLTVCAKDHKEIFGRIDAPEPCVGGGALDAPHDEVQVTLTKAGVVIENWIQDCEKKYSDLSIWKYVIMPNHIHLLVHLENGLSGVSIPTTARPNERIPIFVSGLKRMTNKACDCNLWQRGYHDHVVRNDADYLRIWQYIDTNPAKWAGDKYYTG